MTKETIHQKNKMAKVMHEYKDGDLKSSSGKKVTDRKQAIAIGMHEAGISRDQHKGH